MRKFRSIRRPAHPRFPPAPANAVFRGNLLGNPPGVKVQFCCFSAVTSVVTGARPMRCFAVYRVVYRCLVTSPANARFHGYRLGYQCLGYRTTDRLISGHTAQAQQSVGCRSKRKPGSRPGCVWVRYLRGQQRQHPTPGGGRTLDDCAVLRRGEPLRRRGCRQARHAVNPKRWGQPPTYPRLARPQSEG